MLRFYDYHTGKPLDTDPDHSVVGYLSYFLDENDPDPAEKQLDKHYQHGGGFRHFDGFTLDPKTHELSYPEDPNCRPIARAQLRDEQIIFYPHAWTMVLQKDGSFRIARMD